MPINQALKDLMITAGTFQNISSRDVYGKRIGGASTAFNCHLTLNRTDQFTPDSASAVSYSANIIMDGVYDVQDDAIVVVEGITFKAARVTTYFDEVSSHHTSVEMTA